MARTVDTNVNNHADLRVAHHAFPCRAFCLLLLTMTVSLIAGMLAGSSQPVWATEPPVALTDDDLNGIAAGDLQFDLESFNVLVHDNEAGYFTMDIAQSAFNGAQGVFTTLQAVNSAVDLSVVVNIFLNGPSP